MQYQRTLTSAREYGAAGRLEEWVHTYLLSDGHNKLFSDGLKLAHRYYIGPLEMPLGLFARCCGPEETMKYRTEREGFEKHVCALADAIAGGADLPPLIVCYKAGTFVLSDGNHRWEAFTRLGVRSYPVIVWITEKTDRNEFLERYAEYLP